MKGNSKKHGRILNISDLRTYFPGLVHASARVGPRTLIEYQRDAMHYLAFCGGCPERSKAPQALREWRTNMVECTDLSPNTINRRLIAVKFMVHASVASGDMDPGVAYQFGQIEPVKKSALRHRLRRGYRAKLSPDEVRYWCHMPDASTHVGLRDRALLHLMASSGCRISEVVSINREDIEHRESGCYLEVLGKGQDEPRQAPLSKQAYEWVMRWLSVRDQTVSCSAVFTILEPGSHKPCNARISVVTAYRRIKNYARQAGLPHAKPHDLRRFVGTQLTERYGLRAAQLALGHASPDTTARFYVLDELQGGMTDGLY